MQSFKPEDRPDILQVERFFLEIKKYLVDAEHSVAHIAKAILILLNVWNKSLAFDGESTVINEEKSVKLVDNRTSSSQFKKHLSSVKVIDNTNLVKDYDFEYEANTKLCEAILAMYNANFENIHDIIKLLILPK